MGFRPGPWLDAAVANGLIAPSARPVRIEPPDLGCSEKEFQAAVVALAQGCGWKCYHTRDSRGSAPGFPDWVFCRPPTLVIAELKAAKGRVTTEQREWLDVLALVPGVVVKLWRPDAWDEIVQTLGVVQ